MLLDSKSNLARLMATENLMIEQKQVQTAYFDIKNRILTIPILNGNLSAELYDLLLGHEVGHALETPAEGWHDSVVDLKVNRTILNVCEDARIEKKIKRKFPGIRISFVKGYKELMELDFFGVKDTNLNDLNFIDRVNLYTKGGAAQGIEFLPEETSLLEEVELAETFEETVEVAVKIQKFMEEELKNQPQTTMNQMQFEEDEDGDFEESEDANFGDEGNFDDADGNVETILRKKSSKSSNDSDSNKEVKTLGRNASNGTSTNKIQSNTDRWFREKEKELYSKENRGIVYGNVPKISMQNTIFSYEELLNLIRVYYSETAWLKGIDKQTMIQDYTVLKNESSKVVSYLVKEFELRKNASQLSRAKVSKTGELNLSKVYEYQFTDDIFKRMTTVPNGKSHGLVMFVDWSGSMIEYLGATIKQLLNLIWFCKKVNIPFEVYAFTSHRGSKTETEIYEKTNVGDLYISPVSLMNIFSSKMKTKEFTEMASYLLRFASSRMPDYLPPLMHLSGTPLNEAVISAFEVVEDFKKKTKAEIVNTVFLTDGEGTRIYGYLTDKDFKTNNDSYTNFNTYRNRLVFRDPVTKASVDVELEKYDESQAQTVALLKLLKARVGGNIIGFYIASSRDARHSISSYLNTEGRDGRSIESHIQSLRRNKYTYIANSGYDEYYFLRSDGLDTDDDAEITTKNVTTRALVTAFSKYTTNRIGNRLVLNRFINLIS